MATDISGLLNWRPHAYKHPPIRKITNESDAASLWKMANQEWNVPLHSKELEMN